MSTSMDLWDLVPWHRYALIAELARLLHEKSPWFGKSALQKIVYLLQKIGKVNCGYRFDMRILGPTAPILLVELDFMESLGAVKIEFFEEYGIDGYKICIAFIYRIFYPAVIFIKPDELGPGKVRVDNQARPVVDFILQF